MAPSLPHCGFLCSMSPASWSVGNWSTCSRTCGGGTQSRLVQCTRRAHFRDEPISASLCPQPAPSSHQACNSQSCPPAWSTGPWTEVTRWGGEGTEAGPHTVGCSLRGLGHSAESENCPAFAESLTLLRSALGPVGKGGGREQWLARAPTPQPEPSCCATLPAPRNPSRGPTKSACSRAATSTRSCSGWCLPGPRYAHQIPSEWGQPHSSKQPASASSSFTVSSHTVQVLFPML